MASNMAGSHDQNVVEPAAKEGCHTRGESKREALSGHVPLTCGRGVLRESAPLDFREQLVDRDYPAESRVEAQ
jgi:hypothetical protein